MVVLHLTEYELDHGRFVHLAKPLPHLILVFVIHQSLKNIQAILEQAGMTLENVVSTTIYLSDIAHFQQMNEVYAAYFKENCPARAAFQVAALPKNALVEIQAVACQ